MSRIAYVFATVRACLVVAMLILTSSSVFATSAQIEMADPVLPIPKGVPARGTASYDNVVGGNLYDSAGNLGATFPLGQIGKGQLYFCGDIFSWVKNPNFTEFRPQRVVYTLEPGYNYISDNNEFRFFIKHQSFHDPDVLNTSIESYELYGLSYRWLGHPQQYSFRVGYYLNTCHVDYKWDLSGAALFYIPKIPAKDFYLELWLHYVSESSGGGFTDYAGEVGMTIHDGLKIFGRYELLHDLDRFDGTADQHLLVGPKYIW